MNTLCELWTDQAKSVDHYRNIIFRELCKLTQDDVLCDVTLIVGPEKVPVKAHRIILSTFFLYFRKMFTNEMKESTENVVHLPCVEPDSMNVILNYVYNGMVKPAKENVLEIIVLANYFMCEVLIDQCCNFIRQFTNVHNCARILQFALNYDINQLKESTKLYIIDHIKPVSEVNLEFNELPADLMIDMVQHPAAVICTGNPAENEKQLFALLWRKIASLPEEAQTEYIPKLLKAVHLPVIRDDYLKLIEKKVSHVEGTRDVLEEARKTVDWGESREWYLPR